MLTRAITGFFFVIVMVAAIWFSFWSMLVLFSVITFIGIREFHALRKSTDPELKPIPLYVAGLFAFAITILRSPSLQLFDQDLLLPGSGVSAFLLSNILIGGVLIYLVISDLFEPGHRNFALTSNGLFTALYIGVPFGLLFHLIMISPGDFNDYSGKLVLIFFVLLWCNDTFAYLTGKFLGRTKLWERISPNKTWEGFIGGMLFSIIAFRLIDHYQEMHLPQLALFGIPAIVSIFGTLGDLSESLLKRQAGVKDSGQLLPGHGGVLDRFDGILLSMPALTFFISIYSLFQ